MTNTENLKTKYDALTEALRAPARRDDTGGSFYARQAKAMEAFIVEVAETLGWAPRQPRRGDVLTVAELEALPPYSWVSYPNLHSRYGASRIRAIKGEDGRYHIHGIASTTAEELATFGEITLSEVGK